MATYEEVRAARLAKRAEQTTTRISMPDYPVIDRTDARIVAASESIGATWDEDRLCYVVPSTDRTVVAVLNAAIAEVVSGVRAASKTRAAASQARTERNDRLYGYGRTAIDRTDD